MLLEKVLAYIETLEPDRFHPMNKIAKEAGVSVSTARRHINTLEARGIIEVTRTLEGLSFKILASNK